MIIRNQRGLHLFLALGLLSACGDDGKSDAETDTNATDDGTADDDVDGGTESGTDAGTETADTDADTTDADTMDAETTDADTMDAETTDADTTDAEEETDAETTDAETGNEACADLESAEDCMAMAGCQVVNGSHLKENGPDSPCLEPSEFLGCIAEQACDDAISWFCQGNNTYQVPDTCGPDGAEPCDGPADVEACP